MIIPVKVTDNANVTTVSQAIQNAYPNQLTATTAADQANRINQGLGFINTASYSNITPCHCNRWNRNYKCYDNVRI